jgi:hypothetical protein
MHDLPDTAFGSKDHRDPQIVWGGIFVSAESALEPLYLHNVGKLGGYALLYDLEASMHPTS